METDRGSTWMAEADAESYGYDPEASCDRLTPGFLADSYEFLREIGHGAQGKVYLARRLSDGVQVAVKQLSIDSVKSWKDYDLFRREASVLSSLNIRGVAHFYEAIERLEDVPPCCYIVQEYIQGKTLARMIESGHRFSLVQVYDILIQLLTILKALHGHVPPVIHRDIKPSNILLKPLQGDAYQVYIIDFGAVANPQVQGGGSTVAGTYGFMPPEQLMSKPCPESDIYSLAAVAVNLISGKSPQDMPVKDFRLIFEPDMQSMPPVLVNTLRAMLEPKVEHRLTDIDKLIETFENFRNNCYQDASNKTADDLKPKEYNHLLEQVSSICQPGNIELWQRLPDQTPRRVPECYTEIQTIPKDSPAPVPQRISKQTQLYEIATGNKVHFEYEPGMILGILIFSVVFAILFYAWAPLQQILNAIIGLILGLFVARKYARWYLNSLYDPRKYIRLTEKQSRQLSYEKEERIQQLKAIADGGDVSKRISNAVVRQAAGPSDIRALLRNGRKTIAVITKIEYIPANHKYIKSCQSDSYLIDDVQYEVYSRPMFEVSYKFNPPDDEKAEDLIHSILTPVNPEGHYKVGDPLPILYLINRRVGGMPERVNSMPFPMPLHDIMDLSDVIYLY